MVDYNNEKCDESLADSVNPLFTTVLPVVLIVDTSASIIKGGAIDELNRGLQEFYIALNVGNKSVDNNVEKCTEFSVISFGSDVNIKFDFQPADVCRAPVFSSDGPASMNQALLLALSAIQERKEIYKSCGIRYYRPWIFVLTDGLAANDCYESEAVHKVREAVKKREIMYMPVGVGSADIKQLKKYYPEDTERKVVLIEPNQFSFENVLSICIEYAYPTPRDSSDDDIKLSECPLEITIGI